MSRISDIEGIGSSYAAKLKEAGVSTLERLLAVAGDKKGRKELAEKTGISEAHILNWVNRADLSRIKGVSTQYADLLEHAGVDTVPELAQRNPENLHAKMIEVNDKKRLVRRTPPLSQVQDWVRQAKALPRAISH